MIRRTKTPARLSQIASTVLPIVVMLGFSSCAYPPRPVVPGYGYDRPRVDNRIERRQDNRDDRRDRRSGRYD